MRELLLQRVHNLLRDFSLKKGSAQYLSRIRFITTFLVEFCGCHPDHIWPISYTNVSLFMAYIQSLSRSQSTFNGYAAAVDWFHAINRWTGLQQGAAAPYYRRLKDACLRANFREAQGREEITPALCDELVACCLARSKSPTDCWRRAATVFALLYDGRARVMEVLGVTTDRIRFAEGGAMEILLTYDEGKTISLTSGRRSTGKDRALSVQWLTFPVFESHRCGARLLRQWWHACDLGRGGTPQPVFMSAQTGRPITYSTVRRQMIEVLLEMGLDPTLFCTHSMRIGKASEEYRQGCPLKDIRESLRHVPGSRSTFRYLPFGASEQGK